jgi:N-acetylmuramoyl-L-alanine amidase
MKILIDNGHGENTPGKRSPLWADGTQLFEWEYTREIAAGVENELKIKGIEAERIVKENIDVPLSERCRRVNEIARRAGVKNCLLVSIHNNAANGKARGWGGKYTPVSGKARAMNMQPFFGTRQKYCFLLIQRCAVTGQMASRIGTAIWLSCAILFARRFWVNSFFEVLSRFFIRLYYFSKRITYGTQKIGTTEFG